MLQAMTKEQNAFHGQVFHNIFFEAIVTSLDLAIELISIPCMERSLSIQHFEENNTNGPNICLVRVSMLLHDLRGHVQRSSTNSFVDLAFVFQLLRETKISDFKLEPCLGKIDVSQELFLFVLVHVHELLGMIWEMHHNVLKL